MLDLGCMKKANEFRDSREENGDE